MKVSEAETKVCPFMNGYEIIGTIAISEPCKCVTSECMAWVKTKGEIHTFDINKVKWVCPDGYEFIEYNANGDMLCYEISSIFGYCQRLTSGS